MLFTITRQSQWDFLEWYYISLMSIQPTLPLAIFYKVFSSLFCYFLVLNYTYTITVGALEDIVKPFQSIYGIKEERKQASLQLLDILAFLFGIFSIS